jgi:hypothetical protein
MIEMAILLGQAGHDEYWGYAERFMRNHLLESQLVDLEQIRALPALFWDVPLKPTARDSTWPIRKSGYSDLDLDCPPNAVYTDDEVLERVKGGFAGWSNPNDFFGHRRWGYHMMMHCCSAYGIRALYSGWHNCVKKRREGVFLNMMFSRRTPWFEVDSHLPYEGRLDITIYDAPVLFVRVPEWSAANEMRIERAGQPMMMDTTGAYLRIAGLRPGERLVVRFPVPYTSQSEVLGGTEYSVQWKGNSVVDIDPPGPLMPLYQRRLFREEHAPLRAGICHYIPPHEIDW